MPLKSIPSILSPELLHTLASMGHGDEIVLADAHFPTSSICRCGPKELRADGNKIPELLKAVLCLLPLDQYCEAPVVLMDRVPTDKARNLPTPIWTTYQEIVNEAEQRDVVMDAIERFEFYERAKKTFAVIHTGELAQYGNIILKKGIVL